MRAWWLMIGDRRNGYTPYASMHLFAASVGLSFAEEQDFIFLINRLDHAYIQWLNKKEPSSGQPPGSQPKDGAAITRNPRQR